ncbi:Transposon Tf2-9 polyprotein [Smittium culicis]|uniref:Transposon Tf2-9 polyprotein n=1 Tax=Smittium culicis TaxID=133412 RepID=A0A1R1XZ67_9FUNG|nr:Transposon Tf2-9 polyprotein [Smittium culicis]
MTRNIHWYIRSCHTCQITKHRTVEKGGELQPLVTKSPFEIVYMDHFRPCPETVNKNNYILVFTDLLTRWVEVIAVQDLTSENNSKMLLEKIISVHGCPEKILSDNGTLITGNALTSICKKLNIKKIYASPYHPKTNGLTERFNRTLKAMLRAFVNESNEKDGVSKSPYWMSSM